MIKGLLKGKVISYILFASGGLLLGWILFHSREVKHEEGAASVSEGITEVWTCAMHPQIRMSEPGSCPICGMELILLNQSSGSYDPGGIRFTKEAEALANVQTTFVSRGEPIMEVRLYGKIQSDERLLQNQVAHISGRVDKLFVNFTGERVQKGQRLALIYSPELITAQQELLEAIKTRESQADIYQAAKERLRQWKLTEAQISNIEATGSIQSSIELVSNTNGIVTGRKVNNGDYISRGDVLYEIADLSKVWVLFEAYESDLPFLSMGNELKFTVQALPGLNFSGNIIFIDPLIDPLTRVAKVRAEINNQSGVLKPEMFATGIVSAHLKQYKDNIIIPKTAVLWTGKRSIVYIKITDSTESVFKMREVELGPMLGESYVILGGLNEGDEIVSNGSFSIDAAAQLEGRPSMMNPEILDSASDPAKDLQNPSVPLESKTDKYKNLQQKDMIRKESIGVSGNCEMCKERIESAAKSVNGVLVADWNIETRKLRIEYDGTKTNIDSIHKTVAKAGHDTDKAKTEDKTYNSLPECCLYRK